MDAYNDKTAKSAEIERSTLQKGRVDISQHCTTPGVLQPRLRQSTTLPSQWSRTTAHSRRPILDGDSEESSVEDLRSSLHPHTMNMRCGIARSSDRTTARSDIVYRTTGLGSQAARR
ncbi:hypothetical protein ACOMHN_007041 [Nucella lapillus]